MSNESAAISASIECNPRYDTLSSRLYMLLSPEEIAWFLQALRENNPPIYQDEYMMADLTPDK